VVIFPTLFGFYLAFHDWNLSSFTGREFSGLDNLRACSATRITGTRSATW
jgi:multiple sugar transport system permease protein